MKVVQNALAALDKAGNPPEAEKKVWKFWDTQPVPKLCE